MKGANKNSDYGLACVISMENTKTKHSTDYLLVRGHLQIILNTNLFLHFKRFICPCSPRFIVLFTCSLAA